MSTASPTGLEADLPAVVGWKEKLRQYGPAGLAFVGVLVIWELATRLFSVESFILPKPSEIMDRFWSNAGTIWPAGFRTLYEAVGGFLFGVSGAILMALVSTRFLMLRRGLLPFAIAANSMPIVALAPIANSWFTITSPVSKMMVVSVIVFFPVMINTTRGLLEVAPAELELMNSLAATPRQILWRVRVPSAIPFFFSALKVAAPLSIIGAIVAEYFGGPQDVLGQYLINRANLFQFPDAWAAILVASLLGIGFYTMVVVLEWFATPGRQFR